MHTEYLAFLGSDIPSTISVEQVVEWLKSSVKKGHLKSMHVLMRGAIKTDCVSGLKATPMCFESYKDGKVMWALPP